MAVKIQDVVIGDIDNKVYDFLDEVKFELRGEKYERFGCGSYFHKTYEGPAWEVVQSVAKNHSYFQFNDMSLDEIKEQWPTVAEMIEEVNQSNGDGCDFIHEWIDVNRNVKVIEQFVNEED